ncbi:hypothetical protein D9611_012582 [Ephemerocybe angulata]|uniref:Uncharacterized protein n=1 Tax=Ephemerocybe angulata TaxID=980116 RepID=A0A8H5AUM2_9AGAR|nr:hypothetical protein D9611_012582 [Tulosesus angulatus]
MVNLKQAAVVGLFAALEVYARASILETHVTLAKRGSCDEPCGIVATVDGQCKATANYEKCVCTADNLGTVDYCFACLIQDVQLNEAANSVLTGDSTTSGISETTIANLKTQAEQTHKDFLDSCKDAGISLSGGTASGGSTSTGGTTSGGTTGSKTGTSSGGASSSGAASSGTASAAGSSSTDLPGLVGGKNGALSNARVAGGAFLVAMGALVALL